MDPTPFAPWTMTLCAVELTLIVYLLPHATVKLDNGINWVEGYRGSPALTHGFC
jgi:hypothetical protein